MMINDDTLSSIFITYIHVFPFLWKYKTDILGIFFKIEVTVILEHLYLLTRRCL